MFINLVFFQNCISPHQIPFIKQLSFIEGVGDVYVIVPESDLLKRKNMGWNSEDLDISSIKILVNPSIVHINNLYRKYEQSSTWCLYSGISSFPFVKKCFLESLSYTVKRAVITEPPFLFNHPLWQHKIRFAIKDWRYVKFIDKIFVMGDDYLSYYKIWSNKWNVIPFMYCTEWKERNNYDNVLNNKLKILFVGSLSKRKNVQLIFKSIDLLSKEEAENIEVGIIGDGEEMNNLIYLSNNKPYKTTFYGTIPMNKISDIMQQYDILCLPSLHDGWGAVINEAITLGLYALCSDSCGSKYLIKKSNYICGDIFKNNNSIDLKLKIKKCLLLKNKIKNNITLRIEWAKNNIKGKKVAQYLIDNLKK